MRVSRVRIFNFLCFKGDHIAELGPGAYAVGAQRDGDRERSNASGKTAFLESFGFALWGRHRHRTEDAWISRGEPMGEVELTLDNGVRILRTRSRGKSTALRIFEGSKEFTKRDAEARIVEILGIGEKDYYATRHLEQRQVARLVLAKPEDRMESVSAWVGLGPLERAEERSRELLGTALRALEEVEKERQKWKDRLEYAYGTEIKDRAALTQAMKNAQDHCVKMKERVDELEDDRSRTEIQASLKKTKAEYDELVAEGSKLKKLVEKANGPELEETHLGLEHLVRDATGSLGRHRLRLEQLAGPAKGTFDGQCPIAILECPATKAINKDRVSACKAHKDELEETTKARALVEELTRNQQAVGAKLEEYRRQKARLEDMRTRAVKLQPEAERATKVLGQSTVLNFTSERLLEAKKAHEDAVSKFAHFTWACQSADEAIHEMKQTEAKFKELVTAEETASTAVLIFGRNGAQRRVAETALAQIEARANEALEACGVDLTVAVTWGREGQGLATACDTCGHPFPSSVKIKQCGRCNAERGPKMVHRLDLDLSDRSGALEDFAGLTTALSAGAWLSDSRGAAWGTILVDEAWGQLDAAHRRSLSSGLPRMLESWGAEQAFVTAHHNAVLDALPHRIEISRRGEWSEVRVIG